MVQLWRINAPHWADGRTDGRSETDETLKQAPGSQIQEQRDAACLIVRRAFAAWTAARKELSLLRGPSAFQLDAHSL